MTENILTPPKEELSAAAETLESSAGGWFDCDVWKAGPAEDGTIFIWLQDVNGRFNHWFAAAPSVKRDMLATALAAIAGKKRVHAYVNGTDEYSTLERFYIFT